MRFIPLTLSLLLSISTFGQDGYKIDFKVKGLGDPTAYLAYYYGESTYLKDTAQAKMGSFTFTGPETLGQGVYLLVLNKTRVLEFVVGHDQKFLLETSASDYVKNMKVTGDDDNTLFFQNLYFNMDRHKEAEPFLKIIRDSTLSEDKKEEARNSFSLINNKVIAHQEDLITNHPSTMTARLLKASQQIQVPKPPRNADGTIDSTFQYKYYRTHFFDNFDLADDAMIRLPNPLYAQKLTEYLEKLFVPHPDTIVRAIDNLVAKVKHNQETYKYLVWNSVIMYQNPKIMGLDEVYVRLYDKYFASGEMDFWVNEQIKKNMKEYADKLRLSLVGQTAKNMIMQDQNLTLRSLYDINKKYTIIFFFDPDCGHCKVETPKLVDFYKSNKERFDLEVYAVSADTSMQKMKEYISEMKMPWITVNGPRSTTGSYQKLYDAFSTPTIYILDRKKKIIAKKPPVERLGEFLENYERMEKQRNGIGGDH